MSTPWNGRSIMCVLLTMNYNNFLHSCIFGKLSLDRFVHCVLWIFNVIHSMHFDCSKSYKPTSAHTACKILHVICTYQPSYMFQWVSAIFREMLSQRHLYNLKGETSFMSTQCIKRSISSYGHYKIILCFAYIYG